MREVLLSIALPNDGYTAAAACARCTARPSSNINFPTPIPVHITYQTAFVDDAGKLQVRDDIYGIDAKTKNLIRSERGVVEPHAGARPPVASRRTGATAARPKAASSSTVGFFEQLFGGGQPPQRPAGRAAAAPRASRTRPAPKRPTSAAVRAQLTPNRLNHGRCPQVAPVNYSGPRIRLTAATFRHSPPVAICASGGTGVLAHSYCALTHPH